ncbi:MAG: inorganic pyrophosphatase, partial [Chitinophagia bacterium]|nr:inorganic pyrophosphatase [Chitinophagia bacterium]
MPDFNKVLETGDYQNGLLNVVNEIPKGSTLKIEWDRERAAFTLDRVEPAIYAKPVNYGFIPKTLDEDGDELDVLIVTDEPIPTGVWLKTRILGVLNFVDDGENDHKVVVVPEDDRNSGGKFQTLEDLGEQYLKQLEEHFKHYKDLKKPGSTVVN